MHPRWRCILATVLIAVLQALGAAGLDDVDTALREEALAKLPMPLEEMSIAQLRFQIVERGQQCKACAEKADYLQRAYEVIHLPEIPRKRPEFKGPKPGEGHQPDPENIKKILENMKAMPGMEGMKAFTKDDIEKLKQHMEL